MEPETTPTEPEVVETQEPVEAAEPVTEDEPNVEEVTETTEAPATEDPAPEPAPAPEPKEVEEEFVPRAIERPDLTAPNIQDFVDPEGNLDLIKYQTAQGQWMQKSMDAVVNSSREAATMASRYEKEWNKAEDTFPALKKDKGLKDMVMAIHADSTNPGRTYLSPTKAAEKLFGVREAAKAEGAAGARETRTVQQAAALANPNPPAKTEGSGDTKLNQLKEQMRHGKTAKERQEASAAYLEGLVKTGRL